MHAIGAFHSKIKKYMRRPRFLPTIPSVKIMTHMDGAGYMTNMLTWVMICRFRSLLWSRFSMFRWTNTSNDFYICLPIEEKNKCFPVLLVDSQNIVFKQGFTYIRAGFLRRKLESLSSRLPSKRHRLCSWTWHCCLTDRWWLWPAAFFPSCNPTWRRRTWPPWRML